MSPTKYCNAIQCTDCENYTECLEHETEVNESKGKFTHDIKMIENED